jgi:hypothetical protein
MDPEYVPEEVKIVRSELVFAHGTLHVAVGSGVGVSPHGPQSVSQLLQSSPDSHPLPPQYGVAVASGVGVNVGGM